MTLYKLSIMQWFRCDTFQTLSMVWWTRCDTFHTLSMVWWTRLDTLLLTLFTHFLIYDIHIQGTSMVGKGRQGSAGFGSGRQGSTVVGSCWKWLPLLAPACLCLPLPAPAYYAGSCRPLPAIEVSWIKLIYEGCDRFHEGHTGYIFYV